MIIEDGRTGDTASVNSENQLNVSAVTENEIEYISHHNHKAFIVQTADVTEAVTEVLGMYVKCTSTTDHFHMHTIIMSANGDGWFMLKTGSGYTGGTSITAVNMDVGSAVTAELTTISGSVAGTVTGGSQIYKGWVGTAGGLLILETGGGLIIEPNQTFTASFLGNGVATLFNISVIGYFEEVG